MSLENLRDELQGALLDAAHENMGPGVAKLFGIAYGILADLQHGRIVAAPEPGPSPEEALPFEDDRTDEVATEEGDEPYMEPLTCCNCGEPASSWNQRGGFTVAHCGQGECEKRFRELCKLNDDASWRSAGAWRP